jgi:tetratricopeptide (TPR) repeat protein
LNEGSKKIFAANGRLSTEANQYKHWMPALICTALVILTFITFWQLKDCSFVNYDDSMYVYENTYVQSGLNWDSVKQAFSFELAKLSGHWHPVTWLSWMLDYQFFGLNATAYHLVNLFFHVMNTLLLFLILLRMTRTIWPCAFVAALFAIHPLHVESVAWIAERKDVLSTFFWMITLGAYSYYVEHPGFRRYLPVILFFALGLMAKPMLITLPFVLLLLDYWPLRRFAEINPGRKFQSEALKTVTSDKQKKKSKNKNAVREVLEADRAKHTEYKWSLIYPLLWEKIPLFVLAILSSIVTYFAAQSAGAVHSESIPLFVRIGNAFISYIAYIGKMIWPSNLAVFYPYTKLMIPWQVLGSILLLIAITLVVIWRVKKFPYLATGWLWYIGTLVPVIGIVQAGSQAMADRYTYIPLIGLFIVVAWGVPELLKEWKYRKEMLFAAAALSIMCLSIISWKQVGYWQNNFTLYDHALAVTENSWLAYDNRGVAYYSQGGYKQAIEDFNRAIEIKPHHEKTYNNRGNAYHALGRYRQAIEDFNKAIEIKTDFPEAYNNRGNAYLALGNYKLAMGDINKAMEIKPDYATAHNSRGNVYQNLGNYHQAIEDYGRAIENKPRYAEAYYNRGTAYNKLGNYRQAIEDLNRAINLKPDYPEAYVNRGFACKGLGNYQQAIEDYGSAIQIKPDYTFAYLNRGAAYVKLGNNDRAVNDLKMAAKLGDENAKKLLKGKGISW